MKHNHSCKCEHSSVRFCKHCNTVYCEGCNQEWTSKATWTYANQYNQPSWQKYVGPLAGTTSSNQQLRNTNPIDLTQCSHKE